MVITGTLFNTLTFGGVNSGDYGVYISGEGVFNAPVRAVEMISVPGRNGDLALDLGHYENITVTYPAGIYGDDNVDFRERLSEFRNAILSQKGYQRLEDSYHPDEFRLGIYTEGLEVAPVHYNEAGQFELVFNCKPQRFLNIGEDVISYPPGLHGKNYLVYPYYNTSGSAAGVTYTLQADGTVLAEGTSTGTLGFFLYPTTNRMRIDAGEYIVNGAPKDSGFVLSVTIFGGGGGQAPTVIDTGEGAYFKCEGPRTLSIQIKATGAGVSGPATIKPMIRLASDTDPTFEPYEDLSNKIINPTLFESSPLLAIYGDGDVNIGDSTITLVDLPTGLIPVLRPNSKSFWGNTNAAVVQEIENGLLNLTDSITVNEVSFILDIETLFEEIERVSLEVTLGTALLSYSKLNDYGVRVEAKLNPGKITNGNNSSAYFYVEIRTTNETLITLDYLIAISKSGNTVTSWVNRRSIIGNVNYAYPRVIKTSEVFGDSTMPALGNPTYIDTELGDVYKVEDGNYISANRCVELGSDLPKIAPGTNEVTFDESITKVEITPRWWKL